MFADGKLLHVGRGEFGELLAKLEEQYGIDETKAVAEVKEYDVIVAGGGLRECRLLSILPVKDCV